MNFKIIIPLLSIAFFSCKEDINKLSKNTESVDTNVNDYSKILSEREKEFTQKDNDSLGSLIDTISFDVKTDNTKDFEDGIIHWASIEKPEQEITHLIDKDKVVINENEITIIIDYPLRNKYSFILESKNGFTRKRLLNEISNNYYKIYQEEESSATIKTIPIDKRTKMYNRNETNGKYGIWGHDIADLVLANILVYKSDKGDIILSLEIES